MKDTNVKKVFLINAFGQICGLTFVEGTNEADLLREEAADEYKYGDLDPPAEAAQAPAPALNEPGRYIIVGSDDTIVEYGAGDDPDGVYEEISEDTMLPKVTPIDRAVHVAEQYLAAEQMAPDDADYVIIYKAVRVVRLKPLKPLVTVETV